MKSYRSMLLVLLCSCLVIACDQSEKPEPASFDHAADSLSFTKPSLNTPDTLLHAPPLPDDAQQALLLQRAFFARDFKVLDKALNESHEKYVQGQGQNDAAKKFLDQIETTQLAGIDSCKEWVSAMPFSYAAHWMCGSLWNEGAWVARGHDVASKVTPVRFALMRERLTKSNALLEKALTLSDKPVEAMTLLANNYILLDQHESADALFQKVKAIMPLHRGLYATRLTYALPEWGGSEQKVQDIMAEAKAAGIDETALLDFHDEFVARPWKLSNPGSEKDYWEKALAEKPTFNRLRGLAEYLERMQNWREAVPAATRLLEEYPGYGPAYWIRAQANEKLGNIPAALQDYRMAAAHGHNFAIQSLIQAHIRGGLSLPAQDWAALDEICRYGAALGSSAAANCLGSSFWEGDAIGGPFRTDIPQSFAWHLVAARGGYHNSQYDLGWLLLTGRAPGVGKEKSEENGLFWLRRAAEQDHQFAKKKLQEGGYAESEIEQKPQSEFDKVTQVLLQKVLIVLQYLLSAMYHR